MPAARLLTWAFQVVPVFFLIGGYAHAAALRREPAYGAFLAARAGRLLPPAAVLVGLWFLAGLVLETTGSATGLARSAARIAVQPLWFLGVYVGVTAAAPAMLRLHRRHGLRVVVALAGVTALLDVIRFSPAEPPPVTYLSVATVWLAVHSLGFALYDGALDRIGAPMALLGLGTATALVTVGPYPLSMVGLPGAPVSNMSPPTLALLAHAVWLTGGVVLARPVLRRRLDDLRIWTPVVAANGVVMTAFLWHLTALFGVLAIFPRLATGSVGWWLTRPLVLGGTLLGTLVLVVIFRRFERLRPLPVRPAALAVVGSVASAGGLLALSATGAVGIISGRSARLAGVPVTPAAAAILLLIGCAVLGVRLGTGRVGTVHVAERPADRPTAPRPAHLGGGRADR
jgi:hypothetical protein